MRHDSIVHAGGRTKHTTKYIPVEVSPGKRKRVDRTPEPDLLLPDIAPEPADVDMDTSSQPFDSTEEGFTFDEGHPADTGPRAARESVSMNYFLG